MDKSVAVVIPTIRPEKIERLLEDWKFNCQLFIVYDGEVPKLKTWDGKEFTPKDVMGKDGDLITNFVSACRMLGFAYIAKHCPEVEYIITTDDDVSPLGDPIQDHINALNMRVPVSWMPIADHYTRGFPYGVRDEAEVVLSHGVWENVPDFDAPSQLILGSPKVNFYKMAIPKGVLYPMSIMNVGIKRKLLPYFYLAQKSHGFDRADDVFGGQDSKKEIDKKGWAVVTGYSRVWHDKASNVFENLVKEAKVIKFNETYWQGEENGDYFKLYRSNRKRWRDFCENCSIHHNKK